MCPRSHSEEMAPQGFWADVLDPYQLLLHRHWPSSLCYYHSHPSSSKNFVFVFSSPCYFCHMQAYILLYCITDAQGTEVLFDFLFLLPWSLAWPLHLMDIVYMLDTFIQAPISLEQQSPTFLAPGYTGDGASLVVQTVKKCVCHVGDPGSILRLGRSPGERNVNPLQYSCLENPMNRGAWWATVHGVAKSQTWLSDQVHT